MKLAIILIFFINISYVFGYSVWNIFEIFSTKSNDSMTDSYFTDSTTTELNFNNDTDNVWEIYPDENWNSKKINIKELNEKYSNITEVNNFTVIFRLYTRQHPTDGLIIQINNTEILRNSDFNNSIGTRFITHGWMNNGNSTVNTVIRDAYFFRGDYNIFIVDWSKESYHPYYYTSARKVEYVGEKIAQFIDFLHNYGGLKFENLTLIGHSLGAHASGFAGKKVKSGHIHTIIGLDPARPWFEVQTPDKRLASTDANYVETIHTDTNYYGFKEPLGTASFYPNWGHGQPICYTDLKGCSHGSSYLYFAESLKIHNNYLVVKCLTYKYLLLKACKNVQFDIRMGGEPSNYGKARGVYYVDVNGWS